MPLSRSKTDQARQNELWKSQIFRFSRSENPSLIFSQKFRKFLNFCSVLRRMSRPSPWLTLRPGAEANFSPNRASFYHRPISKLDGHFCLRGIFGVAVWFLPRVRPYGLLLSWIDRILGLSRICGLFGLLVVKLGKFQTLSLQGFTKIALIRFRWPVWTVKERLITLRPPSLGQIEARA